jgi:aspartate/methionine/tyrosine aminotransferase
MEWAKLESGARFNLAKSDLAAYPLAELPVRIEELEIDGPAGYGYAPLQERLARKAGVPPECVVAATGTSMANHLAMAAVLEPGDEVLIEHPTYELLLRVAEYLGATVRRFPRRFEERFAVNPSDVAAAITPATRAVVVTNLHNPSGMRVMEPTLLAVAELAESYGAHLIVDEVYLEAVFDTWESGPVLGRPVTLSPPRSAFHLAPNVIATSSLTKAYGLSGLRCGWVLAPAELAERMWRINDLFGSTAAHPAELLSVIALDHLDAIAARARAILATNHLLLERFLDARHDLATARPDGGTVTFPRLAGGRVEALCRLLRDRYETSVVPGHFFEMPDHFRIGIGGETEMVEEGLLRLGRALDELGA